MLDRWFLAHPRSVGESYLEHMGVALSFAAALFAAGLACAVHGLAPALFTRTGSRAVERLHQRMTLQRRRRPTASIDAPQTGFADYAI